MDARLTDFAAVLHANGADPEHAEALQLYGRFVGDWDSEIVAHGPDGARHHAQGEIHFGWILEGRAIQDVWILPGVFYGTTLRVYDPNIDAWHILWSDPVRQFYSRQIGRAQGDDIVQLGTNDAGEAVRWSFTAITPVSFRWTGERSRDDEKTWQLQAEFFARRAP